MNILTLNVGSSSIKFAYYKNKKLVMKESHNAFNKKERLAVLRNIDVNDVDIIGHRVVHGKDITEPTIINAKLIVKLKQISELAPLHVIPEVEVIEEAMKKWKAIQVAVFDTSFHCSMADFVKMYAIPKKYYAKGIKKYGFHGLSHAFVSKGEKGKVIVCHLGSGASICAIKNGKSVETSMGFTPLDGLMMATRSGSIDPAIIPFLRQHEGLSLEKVTEILNKKSGLLGLSGNKDMEEVLKDKKKHKVALDVYTYRIARTISSYLSILDGLDTIIFTGGVGENSAYIRKEVIKRLSFLNIELDNKLNNNHAQIISTTNSNVKVKVKKTNESMQIVNECEKIWKNLNK